MLSASTVRELRDQVLLGQAASELLAVYGHTAETIPSRSRAVPAGAQGPTRAELKAWGAVRGVHVSDRGRIAAGVLAQYAADQTTADLTVGEGEGDTEPGAEESQHAVLSPTFTPPRSSRPSQARNKSKAA